MYLSPSLKKFLSNCCGLDPDKLSPAEITAYAPQIIQRLRAEIESTGEVLEVVKSAVAARERTQRRNVPVLPSIVRAEKIGTVSSSDSDKNSCFDNSFPIGVE
ncbi:hypothetical protein LCGC14_2125280 [marine sediment metagenome]|uniref:Uncharacterized protein n=1 Tax=marine sediment metagenome TaxID=412755 RepID=A0A0F9EQ83_9ZZZZ